MPHHDCLPRPPHHLAAESCTTLPGLKPSCAEADRSSYGIKADFVAVWKAAGDSAQTQGARRPSRTVAKVQSATLRIR